MQQLVSFVKYSPYTDAYRLDHMAQLNILKPGNRFWTGDAWAIRGAICNRSPALDNKNLFVASLQIMNQQVKLTGQCIEIFGLFSVIMMPSLLPNGVPQEHRLTSQKDLVIEVLICQKSVKD
jgi:hypothetical protein